MLTVLFLAAIAAVVIPVVVRRLRAPSDLVRRVREYTEASR